MVLKHLPHSLRVFSELLIYFEEGFGRQRLLVFSQSLRVLPFQSILNLLDLVVCNGVSPLQRLSSQNVIEFGIVLEDGGAAIRGN